MDIILEKLINIENKLLKIEVDIELLKSNGNNLNNHISFIENVYNSIKHPFYYLINCIPSNKKIYILPKIKSIE